MTRQIFNPLLESNFQKVGEMTARYTVYKRGNTIFADPAPGSGLAKYSDTDLGVVLNGCFSTMGSGTVFMTKGDYYQKTTIYMNQSSTNGQWLRGEGAYATRIITDSTTLTISNIIVGDTGAGNYYWRGGIIDIAFDVAGIKTAGTALEILSGSFFQVDRCVFQNQYDSLKLDGSGAAVIRNSILIDSIRYGIYITGQATAQIHNIITDNPSLYPASTTTRGLYIDDCGTLLMSDCHITHAYVGMHLVPGNGQSCTWFFINNCAFDLNTLRGVSISPTGTGSCRGLYFTASWFSSSSNATNGAGFVTTGNLVSIEDIRLEGCRVYNNQGHGINWSASGSKMVSIQNSTISCNNLGNAGADGMYIGSPIDDLKINDCIIGGVITGLTNNQRYGINSAFQFQNTLITHNDLSTNITGALNFAAIGANVLIQGNIGYNPQPLAAIVFGASPFTYTNNTGCIEQIRTSFASTTQFNFIRAGVPTALAFIAAHTMVLDLYPGDALQWVYPAAAPTATRIPM